MLQDQRVGDHKQQGDCQFARLKQRVFGVCVKEGCDQRIRLAHERDLLAAIVLCRQRAHVFVNKAGDEEGIDRRHSRRFGWGEHTAIDAAEDDHDQEQAPARFHAALHNLTKAVPFAFGQIFHLGHHIDGHHQHETCQKARDHTCKEHTAHGDFHRRGINHHHDGRRDQNTQGACVTDHTGGEFLGVAHLTHACDHDGANRHNSRRRGTGESCKHHAGKHTRNGQTAGQMPHAGDGEADDAARHTTCGHERACQNEEGDRQQGEMPFKGFKQRARHGGQRRIAKDQQE